VDYASGIHVVRTLAFCLAATSVAVTPARAQLSIPLLLDRRADIIADPGCTPVPDSGGPYRVVAGATVLRCDEGGPDLQRNRHRVAGRRCSLT
jgi:hypothetical protein